ncbi:hypothetical protein NQ318_017384 [Aromia moschata]|uniref:Elongator complex protein 4 n=1 Tax=Aromia moschata TaxID=1265417 RepID=A0AAV8Z247_9CUCU|nr:hypothetical protein NQ318_017384 [Aromia moschata]
MSQLYENIKERRVIKRLSIAEKLQVIEDFKNGMKNKDLSEKREHFGEPVTGPVLQAKAKQFHASLNVDSNFSASNGWLARFKKRHGIRCLNIKGQKRQCVFREELKALLNFNNNTDSVRIDKDQYERLYNVFNDSQLIEIAKGAIEGSDYEEELLNSNYNKDSDEESPNLPPPSLDEDFVLISYLMEKKIHNIPGTSLSIQNGQLLTSSGIPSLDSLLGGGLPVGTVAFIEEDFHGSYSKVILKYFLAEGVVSKHSIFIASQDVNPSSIIKELPAVIESEPDLESKVSKSSNGSDKMKIAFRYQNLPTSDSSTSTMKHIGHYFDISKNMSFSDIENSDICYWTGQRIENGSKTFSNPAYNELLKSIKNRIKEGKFFLKDNPGKRSILRIGIHCLGSPMWLPHRKSLHSIDSSRDLDMFIFCLRALVRSAFAVAVITVPTHLYHEVSLDRCIHSSDIAMRLQAFSGTELENNQSLSDYHGFFYLTKLAAINSLVSRHPGSIEYVFKLRRKKFSIEVLHLPPDIQEDTNTKKENFPSLGCGGTNKHLLEF